MIKQRFAKIDSESTVWPSAEVEVLTKSQELCEVMNVYGEMNTVYCQLISWEFGDKPPVIGIPFRFVIPFYQLHNLVIHHDNTKEEWMSRFFRIPLGWMGSKEHQDEMLSMIRTALLEDIPPIGRTWKIENLLENYYFRLGSVRVIFDHGASPYEKEKENA